MPTYEESRPKFNVQFADAYSGITTNVRHQLLYNAVETAAWACNYRPEEGWHAAVGQFGADGHIDHVVANRKQIEKLQTLKVRNIVAAEEVRTTRPAGTVYLVVVCRMAPDDFQGFVIHPTGACMWSCEAYAADQAIAWAKSWICRPL